MIFQQLNENRIVPFGKGDFSSAYLKGLIVTFDEFFLTCKEIKHSPGFTTFFFF